MITKQLLKRLGLCVGLATVLAYPMVSAQSASFTFTQFKQSDLNNPDLEFIDITGTLFNTGSGVKISISNDSVIGDGWITSQNPAVARIYFNGDSVFFPSAPTTGDSSPGVEFQVDGTPNLPGGNEIGFDADFRFAATPLPAKNGLNAGEFIDFNFAGANYATVFAGLESGNVRIGLHIISAGPKGEDSYAFTNNPIPEPSAALLGSLGALSLFRRKK